jgi:lambda family phage portal protein
MVNIFSRMWRGIKVAAQVMAAHTLPPLGFGWGGEKYSGGWGPTDAYLHQLESLDYETLRARSHQMFEQNPYGRGLIRRLVMNEIHTGLELNADPIESILGMPDDSLDAWAEEVEKRFGLWSSSPNLCDYERRVTGTLGWLSSQVRQESVIDGDCLVVIRPHDVANLPTVQIVPGHMIYGPMLGEEAPEGREVRHGVELDASGRQVAYYVEGVRIEAFDSLGRRKAWLVYGSERRVGAVRGAPLLSNLLQAMKEIDRFREAALRKAVVNGMLAMWVEKTEDTPASLAAELMQTRSETVSDLNAAGQTRSYQVAEGLPGQVVQVLQPGEKMHAQTSDGTDEKFGDFERTIVATMAWSLGIPPEIAMLSFNANYSASGAAMAEMRLYLTVTRRLHSVQFTQPVYEDWLISEVANGTIDAPGFLASVGDPVQYATYGAWVRADWIGNVKPHTDILKSTKAMLLQLDRGLTTYRRASRELNGTRFSRNARILAKERALLPHLETESNDIPDTPEPGGEV